ncbi:MAG TPA: hypothetical protein VGC66_15140 [Pyrinomonadaceae bacterium]|jgi:hypothetical protein
MGAINTSRSNIKVASINIGGVKIGGLEVGVEFKEDEAHTATQVTVTIQIGGDREVFTFNRDETRT